MELVEQLATKGTSRILLVVLDGLGGLPQEDKTELEAAAIPNLDRLAKQSTLGLLVPVEPGVTPGSGPAHLALFGYDPVKYQVGRGVLEALGVGLDVRRGDLCCRANFAYVGPDGKIKDRRAGRISTESSAKLCARLADQVGKIEGVEVIVKPGKEHRFAVVFRGEGLADGLTDSDPGHDGLPPVDVRPLKPEADKSARIVNAFVAKCAEVLASEPLANWVLLRGLASIPAIPTFLERYRLNAACVAVYPMYRGLARLVGMEVLDSRGTWDDEVAVLSRHAQDYDFYYLHFKETDMAGEDGDFDAKVELLERFDEEIVPRLVSIGFDVLCITGDHSTPAVLKGHSWHPVPVLIWSKYARPQILSGGFSERACNQGSLGRLRSRELMTVLLAHSLRLAKYGA